MNLSLKHKLRGIIGVLVLFLGIVSVMWGLLPAVDEYQESRSLVIANKISDLVLTASADLALERGLTTAALSSVIHKKQLPPGLKGRIQSHRKDAEKAMQSALDRAALFSQQRDHAGIGTYRAQVSDLESLRIEVNDVRSRVDVMLSGIQAGSLESRDWVDLMTAYIHSGARLRLGGFAAESHEELVYQINRSTKHSIWMIAEHAGLERALIARVTAARSPLTTAEMELLAGYRAIVELNLRALDYQTTKLLAMNIGENEQLTSKAIAALADVKSSFGGEFEQTRKAIYTQQHTGEYPITAVGWLRISTAAIDTVLALNGSISDLSSLNITLSSASSRGQLLYAAAFSLVGAALAILGWLGVQQATNRIDGIQKDLRDGLDNKDLTVRLPKAQADELGAMAATYNSLSEQIEALVTQSMEAGIMVSDSALSMGMVARQTQQSITVQRAGTSEVTSNIDQMIDSIKKVAKNSHDGSEAASHARQQARTGLGITQESVASVAALANDIRLTETVVHRLAAENQEIGGIVAAIHAIADQTNLLALNAAIEAARAGESGRGFAVVADEVRNLARRTQESTHQIENIIDRLNNSTDEAVVAMKRSNEKAADSVAKADETGKAFDSIAESVNTINDLNGQIAQATEQQVSVFSSLSQNMRANIQQFEHLSSDSAEKTRQSGVQLGEAVAKLQTLTSQYVVSGRERFALNNGKHTHLEWKNRIRSFLDDTSTLTLEQVSHHLCDFGQWYDSAAARQFMDVPAMAAIEKPHEELHRTLSEVVRLKEQNRPSEAEALYGDVVRLCEEIVGHIEEAERDLGFGGSSILTLGNGNAEEADDDVLF